VASHKFLNPSTMPATRGYTHVVETRGPGRTTYLAGQLGMMPDGKFAGAPGDFRAQATQAFENVKLGLAAVGATFEHVVKLTVFFTDIANLPTYFEVRDRYVNTKAPPSSTAVQISKLARRRRVRSRGDRGGAGGVKSVLLRDNGGGEPCEAWWRGLRPARFAYAAEIIKNGTPSTAPTRGPPPPLRGGGVPLMSGAYST
jgi:enamine deaminase RidA (YjgF/YER057c/UK114 family)